MLKLGKDACAFSVHPEPERQLPLAGWLAEQLNRPLVVKRASDLLGAYVGETEGQVAQAFEQARKQGAVLLMDEIDSFLQSRDNARQRWEISLVNEMLTQMERFEGVFIASTNRLNDLDEAAMRRFDFKIHFNFLLPLQLGALFSQCCARWGLECAEEQVRDLLCELTNATPGDLAALDRRHRVVRFSGAGEVANALKTECQRKSSVGKPIGSLQSALRA